MKKLVVIFLLLLRAVTSHAQLFWYETKTDVAEEEKKMNLNRQKIVDNHITSAKIYSYKSVAEEQANVGYLSFEYTYDNRGNFTEYKSYKRNGKLKYHNTYEYDNNNRELSFTDWRANGKMLYRYTTSYDSSGNMTDQRSFWKNPDVANWHSIARYDEHQNLVEVKYLIKKDSKYFGRYVYTYYPDGSKKQTIEYNRRDKIKHIWNFDCKPEGISEEQHLKDTSRICIRYETDSAGNKIKIKEENQKVGKVARTISRYNKDNYLLDEVTYDSKERPRNHYHYSYDAKNNLTEFINYKKNSTEIKERVVYNYDASGNMIEELVFKKLSTPDHTLKFTYAKN